MTDFNKTCCEFDTMQNSGFDESTAFIRFWQAANWRFLLSTVQNFLLGK